MTVALVMTLAAPVWAGVEIVASGDRLDVIAEKAPVSEVLDGLARKTRMKVVYEGAVPRTLVTVELRGRTPAEAVLAVLDGLGLNYALVLDVSGAEVETLMIVGTSTGSAAAVRSAARGGRTREAPHANLENPTVESDEPPTPEEVSVPAVPGVASDVPGFEDNPKPAPALVAPGVVGPRNPASGLPNGSPFAPGARVPVAPTPSPPPSSE